MRRYDKCCMRMLEKKTNTNKMIPDIIDSISSQILDDLSSVSDRYYTHKYCLHLDGIQDEILQRVSFHSNRICLISLADEHPIMKASNPIKLNFNVGEKSNRLQNQVSGKGKRGAQKLEPKSILCYVETDSGEQVPIYSCVKGKLLEINNVLLEKPELLRSHPVSNGYIALILPDLKFYQQTKDNLLELAEFVERVHDKEMHS